MTWVALGCLLLAFLIGAPFWRALQRAATVGSWRPGAGVLAIAAFVGSAALGVREAWAPSVLLFLVGIFLSMSTRRVQRAGPARARAEPPPKGGMSAEQARSILGVGPQATAEEIQAAYLRLIRRNHPDQGGSSGLAAQLNAARDVLLGKG